MVGKPILLLILFIYNVQIPLLHFIYLVILPIQKVRPKRTLNSLPYFIKFVPISLDIKHIQTLGFHSLTSAVLYAKRRLLRVESYEPLCVSLSLRVC